MAPPKRNIHYISEEAAINDAAEKIQQQLTKLHLEKQYLGFSMESASFSTSKDNKISMVCVIQIATATDAYIFDVRNFRSIPKKLHTLLVSQGYKLVTYYRRKQLEELDCSFFGEQNGRMVTCVDLRQLVELSYKHLFEQPIYFSQVVERLCGYSIARTPKGMDDIDTVPLNHDQLQYLADIVGGCYDIWSHYNALLFVTSGSIPAPALVSTPVHTIKPKRKIQATSEASLKSAAEWLGKETNLICSDRVLICKLMTGYVPWQDLTPEDAAYAAGEVVKLCADCTRRNPVDYDPELAAEWLNDLTMLTDEQLVNKLLIDYSPYQRLQPDHAERFAKEAVVSYRKKKPVSKPTFNLRLTEKQLIPPQHAIEKLKELIPAFCDLIRAGNPESNARIFATFVQLLSGLTPEKKL